MAVSVLYMGWSSSDRLHGGDQLRRCPRETSNRSELCRLQSNVIPSKHIRQVELWEHQLRHGCIASSKGSSACKGCSNCSKPHCRLQGIYSSSKPWNHSQSNRSTVFWFCRREEGSNILPNDMELRLRVCYSINIQWSTSSKRSSIPSNIWMCVVSHRADEQQEPMSCTVCVRTLTVLSGQWFLAWWSVWLQFGNRRCHDPSSSKSPSSSISSSTCSKSWMAHSLSVDFDQVPKPRPECRVLTFGPKERRQCSVCPEQDCERLVFHVSPGKSIIEILELHEDVEWKDRVEIFKGWYSYTKTTWTWESNEQNKSWKGSSKRLSSVPVSLEERRKNVELIQSRRHLLGRISVMRTSIENSSIQQPQKNILVQSRSPRRCPSTKPSSTSNGSSPWSRASTRSLRMKGCIVHIATWTILDSCQHYYKH